MTRLAEALKVLLLALCCWLAGEAAWLVHGERVTVNSTLRDLHTTILEAGLTLKNLREASAIWAQSSKEQATQTTAAMTSLKDSGGRLSRFVAHTDSSLNNVIFPQLSKAIGEQSDILKQSQQDLQIELHAMLTVTQQLQLTLAHADQVVSDPALKETLVDLDTNMKQAKLLLESGTATAEDVRRVADKFAEQYTKARNIYYAIFKEVLSVGSEGVQFVLKK